MQCRGGPARPHGVRNVITPIQNQKKPVESHVGACPARPQEEIEAIDLTQNQKNLLNPDVGAGPPARKGYATLLLQFETKDSVESQSRGVPCTPAWGMRILLLFCKRIYLTKTNHSFKKLFPGKGIGNFTAYLKLTHKNIFLNRFHTTRETLSRGRGKGLRGEGRISPFPASPYPYSGRLFNQWKMPAAFSALYAIDSEDVFPVEGNIFVNP